LNSILGDGEHVYVVNVQNRDRTIQMLCVLM